jgi:[ribosomal protein S5]-alanine N-acetyltransferase
MPNEPHGATPAPLAGAHRGTAPTLVGDRIVLRAVRPDDVADIVDISVYDGVTATNEAEALAMLRRIEADADRGETVHWGLCLAGSDVVIGTIGFYRGFADGTGEVGYVLRAPFRRRGLMREALALAVAHGFGPLGLATVKARTAPDNAASIGLLVRLGFVLQPSEDAFLTFVLRSDPAPITVRPLG